MPVLAEELERTTRFTRKWTKRWLAFESDTRVLTYAESANTPPKASLVVSRITRYAELAQVKPNSRDIFAMEIAGTGEDGKSDTWTVRAPDARSFEKWHSIVRGTLASNNMMEPVGYGLPEVDPRYGLKFATVPLQYLCKFALLEKAIMYYFGPATVNTTHDAAAQPDQLVAVGDRNFYVFRGNADVVRCVPLENINRIYLSDVGGSPESFAVLRIQPVEHDIVITNSPDLARICDTIDVLHRATKGFHIPRNGTDGMPVDQLVATKGIVVRAPEGYTMKAVSPTPKAKLRIALDLYEKQHGFSFQRGRGKKGLKADDTKSGPPKGTPGGGVSTDDAEEDTINDGLSRLLTRLNQRKYLPMLRKQHVDKDVLSCMDVVDLENFGITNRADAEAIVKGAQEKGDAAPAPAGGGGAVDLDDIEAGLGGGKPAAPPKSAALGDSLELDDLDLGATVTKKIDINVDDDDDLLPAAQPAGAAKPAGPAIQLDDDDDLGLGPAKPAAPAGGGGGGIIDDDL